MIYIIGGSNIDINLNGNDEFILKESNIAKVSLNFGGVARNIAENIANLDIKHHFITAIGNDHFSSLLKEDFIYKNINYEYSFELNDNQSTYIAILDKNKDLYIGFNDMDILNHLNINDFDFLKNKLNHNDYLFLDTNFNKDLLSELLDYDCYKIVDGTSSVKVKKIKDLIYKINLLKLNTLEAETLSGIELNSLESYIDAIKKIQANEIIISNPEGLFYSNKKEIYYYKHNAKIDIASVSGAGDALLSGFTACRYQGKDLDYSIRFALSLALLTLKTKNSVATYDEDVIKDIILNSNIEGEKIYEY